METTIYLVRHGQSKGNATGRMGGDYGITDAGKEQAQALGELLKDVSFDVAITSDKRRTKETAAILVEGRDISVSSSPIFNERDYGVFDQRTIEDYRAECAKMFHISDELPTEERFKFKYYPSYECDSEIAARYNKAIREIVAKNEGKTILIVSHGSAMRVFLMSLGLLDTNLRHIDVFENAGYVKLSFENDKFHIVDYKGLKIDIS